MSSWVEVAPAPVTRPARRRSSSPRLETIFEEGYFGNSKNSSEDMKMAVEVDLASRVVCLLPLVISMASYYFLVAGAQR